MLDVPVMNTIPSEVRAWLADVLARIAKTPQSCLNILLPWNWKINETETQAA